MIFRSLFISILLFGAAGAAAAPLSLADAQRLAAANAPQLEAQSAGVRAAQQAGISASQQADPKLILGVDNLPADGADRFNVTRDFMTMRKIGVMQEFTRDEKLKLRGARAEAEVRKEEAALSLASVNLQRDVALAWIERYFAGQQRALLTEMSRETELQLSTAKATLAGGKGMAADAFSARLANAQIDDRIIDSERLIARAEANLGRWIGAAARAPLDAPPAFDKLSHAHQALMANLDKHPHLAMYAPLEDIAKSDMQLAQAAKHPDWSLELAYQQRGPAYSNMVSIGVRIDLPIFQSRRQDPAIAAKSAQLEQIRAQAEDAKRAHAAEIETMLADWDAANKRIARYAGDLLPLAQARREAALADYRGGRGDLAAVLEARRLEIETRMNQLSAQAEQARAWANLNFLLPVMANAKDAK